MKLKKMVKLLKEVTNNKDNLYTEEELNYMKEQLKVIESGILELEHKNYKGFGKK